MRLTLRVNLMCRPVTRPYDGLMSKPRGQRWGIRPQDAVKVLSDGAGGSRMLQIRGPLMEGKGWVTPTMKVGIWQKDMQLIAAALAEAQVPAPLFAATVPVYNAAMALGHAEHDTAAVFDVLSRMSS